MSEIILTFRKVDVVYTLKSASSQTFDYMPDEDFVGFLTLTNSITAFILLNKTTQY